MKKTTTKVLSALLSLLLAATVLCTAPLTVSAAGDEDPFFAYGECGATHDNDVRDDVQWYVFHDGSIAFFGSGAIQDYEPNSDTTPSAPWYNEAPLQSLTSTKFSVEDGVTEIGNYVFYIPVAYTGFGQIKSIDLPNSLTKIGAHAFENQDKFEKITIPRNVIYIGEDAFKGCKKLAHIDIYGDPDPKKLVWMDDSTPFSQQVTCHIKPEYENMIPYLESYYSEKHVKFEANLHYEDDMEDQSIKRNIKGSFGQESTTVLGNALPFLVVGTFSGAKKSVTYGNNGFASCVKIGNDYYVHTNNSSQHINKATLDTTSGVVTSVSKDAHTALSLQTTYDYIGSNIVRLKFTLHNGGSSAINDVTLGGTGDIKIGADDYAAIKPMSKDGEQIGFYMTSRKNYDKDANNEYATLGFIGKGVKIREGQQSEPATFFYGETAANDTNSATGAYRHRLMPKRIFEPNEGKSMTTGEFAQGKDSGMSYYWDVGTIAADETKQYAVMFSVYGETAESQGTGMIEELTQKYYTVKWQYDQTTVLETQIVKEGDTPEYTEKLPEKAHTAKYDYKFTGWSPEIVACTADTTYTAQFDEIPRKLFAGHSLTLGGDIGVKFYLDVPVADAEIEKVKDGTTKFVVKFDWFNKHQEYQLKDTDYDEASGYFIAQCNVAAAEMAYDINAVAYINDVKYTKEYDTYSVRTYGKYIIDNPADFSLPLVDLAKKMLDYGAKAQVVFDRIPDSPANAGISYEMEEHIITGNYPNMVDGLDGTGLEYYTTSLLFNSKTGLRQYYRVRNQAQFDALSNRRDFKPNGNIYYLEVAEEIPAYELAKKQTFTIRSTTFEYSALDYAMALQYTGDTNEKNLGTAMYWYYAAAKTYFDSLKGAA